MTDSTGPMTLGKMRSLGPRSDRAGAECKIPRIQRDLYNLPVNFHRSAIFDSLYRIMKMRWRYEPRIGSMLAGQHLIRHTLVNEDGVSIWAGPSIDTWSFDYSKNGGDEIDFNVYRKNHEYNVTEPLIGACELLIMRQESARKFKSLPRDVKEQTIAVVIDCIMHVHLLPINKGGHVESVSLSSSMQRLIDNNEDPK